jgi:uncharacterized secreted protein with C-terminal beta-propeller domain
LEREPYTWPAVTPTAAASIAASAAAAPTLSPSPVAEAAGLKSFKSWKDVALFASQAESYGYGYGRDMVYSIGLPGAVPMAAAAKGIEETSGGAGAASEYSTTNVQVEGVDEADIVKNDGKFIYVAGQSAYATDRCGGYRCGGYGTQGKIVVLQAFPPSEAKIVSEISLDGSVSELFVYGNTVVAFGSRDSREFPLVDVPDFPVATQEPLEKIASDIGILPGRYPPYYYDNVAFMEIYDVSDKANPKKLRSVEVKGSYADSRLIDGRVFAVFNENVYRDYPVPLYAVDGVARPIAPSEIKYFDCPADYYSFEIFLGLDLNDLTKSEQRKVILASNAQDVYASRNAFYLTNTRYEHYYPVWEAYRETYWNLLPNEVKEKIEAVDAADFPQWAKDKIKAALASRAVYDSVEFVSDEQKRDLEKKLYERLEALRKNYEEQAEKTVINKIALTPDGGFAFAASGEVPGHILNQFSMDEYENNFRIATTTGQLAQRGSTAANHVFVLDSALRVIGKIKDIAPGESIYSARFMGARAFLVTFKKVDPFFVLDLSDPKNPKILGKLKIPGYSDYLHPYDENHIIGLGKGAVQAEEPGADFAWYQGVKLSLFDVTDLANPKEIAKFEIGDRGTDSFALSDHKAFLFSKSKNLLVIPILLAQINRAKYPLGVEPNTYGDYVFQGAYVFSVSPERGFVLKGRVTHASEEELLKSGEYYYSNAQVKRSLYMNDYLYTVSDELVKANDLASSSLRELASVKIAG